MPSLWHISYKKARQCWHRLSFDKDPRVKGPSCSMIWTVTVFDVEDVSGVVVGRVELIGLASWSPKSRKLSTAFEDLSPFI